MKEVMIYYFAFGLYIVIVLYANSIMFKIKHKDYRRLNPLVSWSLLYKIPIIIIIWPVMIVGLAQSSMGRFYEQQKKIDIEIEDMLEALERSQENEN